MKVITIDGPSAAGKGTIGSRLSEHLNCFYLDTGLLYRQIAAWALESNIELMDEPSVLSAVVKKLSLLNWHQIEPDLLRAPDISEAASKVGTLQMVRKLANEFQKKCAASVQGWIIVDGRDAGTVVFPEAEVKLFITAEVGVRAKRRYAQLKARGYEVDIGALEEEIMQRDLRDQNRAVAPLKPAPDAYIIDTSEETIDKSVRRVLKYLEKYIAA